MQRNQRSSDGWSTALRDDDEDSESDEKAAANDSEPPAPTARSHKAPMTSAAYAQRTEAVREGSDWDWNWAGDAVDIGAVVEPASLKFTETPFTLASRNARPQQAPQKSGTKAKRAAARPGRPDMARGTASAKSDRAAPTTTAVPNRSAVPASASTATKYLNSTRPRPSDAKAPTDQTAPSAAARPLTGRTSNQSARPLGDYSNNATERTLHAPDPKLHSLARRTSGFRPAPKLADDPPPLGPTPVGSETPALTPKYPHGVQSREVLKPACAPPSPNRSSSPLINSTPHALDFVPRTSSSAITLPTSEPDVACTPEPALHFARSAMARGEQSGAKSRVGLKRSRAFKPPGPVKNPAAAPPTDSGCAELASSQALSGATRHAAPVAQYRAPDLFISGSGPAHLPPPPPPAALGAATAVSTFYSRPARAPAPPLTATVAAATHATPPSSPRPRRGAGAGISAETRKRLDRFKRVSNFARGPPQPEPEPELELESPLARTRTGSGREGEEPAKRMVELDEEAEEEGARAALQKCSGRFTLPGLLGFSSGSGGGGGGGTEAKAKGRVRGRLDFVPDEPLEAFRARCTGSDSQSTKTRPTTTIREGCDTLSRPRPVEWEEQEPPTPTPAFKREKIVLGAAIRSVRPVVALSSTTARGSSGLYHVGTSAAAGGGGGGGGGGLLRAPAGRAKGGGATHPPPPRPLAAPRSHAAETRGWSDIWESRAAAVEASEESAGAKRRRVFRASAGLR